MAKAMKTTVPAKTAIDPESWEGKTLASFRQTATSVFERDGYLTPLLFVLEKGKVRVAILAEYDPETISQMLFHAINAYPCVCRISEAWAAALPEDTKELPKGHVKDMPGRFEVAVQTVYMNGFDYTWTSKINRDGPRPVLEEWKEIGPMDGGKCSAIELNSRQN